MNSQQFSKYRAIRNSSVIVAFFRTETRYLRSKAVIKPYPLATSKGQRLTHSISPAARGTEHPIQLLIGVGGVTRRRERGVQHSQPAGGAMEHAIEYDVFLSQNSKDRETVQAAGRQVGQAAPSSRSRSRPWLRLAFCFSAILPALLGQRVIVINTSPRVTPGLYVGSAAKPALGQIVDFLIPNAARPYVRDRTGQEG